MISQLLYVSAATPEMNEAELERIGSAASIYNPLNAITGLLCWDGDRFMQLLEGHAEPVERLYRKIELDPRHRDAAVRFTGEREHRVFGDWAMRCVRVASAKGERQAAIERLLPPTLDGELRELMLNFGERSHSSPQMLGEERRGS